MSTSRYGRHYGYLGQTVLSLTGATIGGLTFAFFGGVGGLVLQGAVAGVLVGVFVGIGYARGCVGTVTLWMTASVVVAVLLGQSCEMHPLVSALTGAGVGVFVALTSLRGRLALIGGVLGLIACVAIDEGLAIPGILVGAGWGGAIGHWILRQHDKKSKRPT